MAERAVAIASRVGLHARPAMLFTQAVAASGVLVTIAKPGSEPVDASSILSVMSLGAAHGDEVVIRCEDDAVIGKLAELLSTDLEST